MGFPGAQEIVNFDRFLLADLYYGSRFNWKQLEQDLMTEKMTKERIATARTDRTMKNINNTEQYKIKYEELWH